jgi:hypothetical protein
MQGLASHTSDDNKLSSDGMADWLSQRHTCHADAAVGSAGVSYVECSLLSPTATFGEDKVHLHLY